MFLVSMAPTRGLHSITWWMLGNLQVTSKPLLLTCSAVIVVALCASWLLARDLNALTLGREMAHFVGVRTSVAVSAGLALATLLAAASVSLAGLIGFVGLIVPHVTRSFVGANHRRLIPFASLAGGLFLAISDVIARSALLGREIPIGVITSLVGGPFFLMILRKRHKQGWIE
jgi:iron complex transport system permease protein